MSIRPSPVSDSRWRQGSEVASIATALSWTLPLLLGAVGAVVNLLLAARYVLPGGDAGLL